MTSASPEIPAAPGPGCSEVAASFHYHGRPTSAAQVILRHPPSRRRAHVPLRCESCGRQLQLELPAEPALN